MLDELLAKFQQHDRRALSRLLTLAARGELAEAFTARLPSHDRPTRVVAITGSAGVGKSTLTGRLIDLIRRQNLTVAVLACDPESPLSHGALLGDRVRMTTRPEDGGVFIRSLAAVSGHGAVADHLPSMVRLLEAFGFDVVIVETVGAGQGDTSVRELADVVVLLLQPEAGDDLQWEKAGVLEIADIVVIHKADMPGADTMEAQVAASLALSNRTATAPVVRVSSKMGVGIEDLWRIVFQNPLRRRFTNRGNEELLHRIQETLARRYTRALTAGTTKLSGILELWGKGSLTTEQAIDQSIELLRVQE